MAKFIINRYNPDGTTTLIEDGILFKAYGVGLLSYHFNNICKVGMTATWTSECSFEVTDHILTPHGFEVNQSRYELLKTI